MAQALRSGGMSEDDIRAWKDALDSSSSADQLKAAIGRGIELVNARLADLQARYPRGAKAPPELLSPNRRPRWTSCGNGPRPPPARNSATTDPVCSSPNQTPACRDLVTPY
jgi:hypothetical protein